MVNKNWTKVCYSNIYFVRFLREESSLFVRVNFKIFSISQEDQYDFETPSHTSKFKGLFSRLYEIIYEQCDIYFSYLMFSRVCVWLHYKNSCCQKRVCLMIKNKRMFCRLNTSVSACHINSMVKVTR